MRDVLLYHPTSPYSRKAAVGLRLRGDDVDFRLVDVSSGEHRSEGFLARSPFGKMPVLCAADGTTVFESTSILEWFEARGPEVLLPRAAALEARRWDRIGDLYLLEPQGALFFGGDADAARRTAAIALDLVETALRDGRAFLCGDAPTLADLSTGIGADQLSLLGEPLPPRVREWLDRVLAIPVMADEREKGLPLTRVLLERRARA